MRFGTIRYTLKQGFKNIARNKMFSIASIATMAACIFLFGIFFAIITNFNHIVKSAEEGVAVVVYFDEDATDSRVEEIGRLIQKCDGVAEVKYVSAEQALDDFLSDYLEGNEDLAAGFKDDNPLVNSDNYEVYLDSVEKQEDVVKYIEKLDGVRKINKSDVVAKTLSRFNVLLAYVSVAIILILLIVAVFLISNTVSMGITIRREEIAIMKYIGAKDAFVRAPFMIEGVIIGVVGAAIPLGILYFAYEWAKNKIEQGSFLLGLEILDVGTVYQALVPISIALGIGIGFLGSFLTIRKHLKA